MQITPGSFHAISQAIPDLAERYPMMCESFLTGLPLKVLGDVEVPSSMVAQDASIVRAANSYTSYKEMWAEALGLDEAKGSVPMVVMEAAMVRLPFSAAMGKQSILRTLVESDVPVETFGAETVKAIISFKWQAFARRQVHDPLLGSHPRGCSCAPAADLRAHVVLHLCARVRLALRRSTPSRWCT